MSESTPALKLPMPLRRQKALKAAWKPLLVQWLVPGGGYWMIGEKGRAKAFFGVWVLFCVLGALQMQFGAVAGVKGGIFGATYVMVAGLLNWLCCFDLWDRITGRWIFRLPKDEQIQKAQELLPKSE